MNNCLIIFIILSFTQNSLFAQNNNGFREDSSKTGKYLYLQAEKFYSDNQFDSAAFYYQKAAVIYNNSSNWINCINSYRKASWSYYNVSQFNKGLYLIQQAIGLSKNFHGKSCNKGQMEIAECYYCLGRIKVSLIEYDEAIDYYKMGLKTINEIKEADTLILEKTALFNHSIGFAYYSKGNYDKAMKYNNIALKLRIEIFGENHIQVADCYNNIGTNYYYKNDFEKAFDFFQKAIEIQRKNLGENSIYVAKSYNNLGIVCYEIGNYDKALGFYLKAVNIKKIILGESTPEIALGYNNIAEVFIQKKDFDTALEYTSNAIEILKNKYTNANSDLAYSYQNMGTIYSEKGNFNTALSYYQKALQIRKNLYGNHHPELAFNFNKIGKLYQDAGKFDKALEFYKNAIISNIQDYKSNSSHETPDIFLEHINQLSVLSKPYLFESFKEIAKTFYLKYQKQNTVSSDLDSSIIYYNIAFQVLDFMRKEFKDEDSKLFLSGQTKESFIDAAMSAFEHNKLYSDTSAQTFEFIEKSKSATLLADLIESRAKQYSGIPMELLEKEKELRTNRDFYSILVNNQRIKKDGYDTIKVQKWNDKYFSLALEYDTLIDYLEKNYTSYYELKFQIYTPKATDIQKLLTKDEALIEYGLGKKNLFIITITNEEYNEKVIPIDDHLEKLVINYYRSIKKGETWSFITYSSKLYNLLIDPVKATISKKAKLIIIPDDYLYYIPFETLTDTSIPESSRVDFSKLNYLISNHLVSYNYSSALWINSRKKNLKEQNNSRKDNFIAFAPVFDKKDSIGTVNINSKYFSALPNSKEEIQDIQELFKKKGKYAKIYLSNEASEDAFKNNIKGYKYIHIATHGFSNDNNPELSGLVFSNLQKQTANSNATPDTDGILYSGEMYNLDLNANLVVLSACETGIGKLIKGEGLIAMTRGFLYSGAPNILFSLWKVPDKHTKNLMVEFYKNILSGSDYSKALTEIKLQMIQKEESSLPKFWGGFILISE